MYAAGGRLGCEKTQSGYRPWCVFVSATFGAGVVAAQRPITRPKRHLPSARYAKYLPPEMFLLNHDGTTHLI
jgi:hypothetical protein